MELEWVINNIMNDIVTFFNELWMAEGHNQGIMNESFENLFIKLF